MVMLRPDREMVPTTTDRGARQDVHAGVVIEHRRTGARLISRLAIALLPPVKLIELVPEVEATKMPVPMVTLPVVRCPGWCRRWCRRWTGQLQGAGDTGAVSQRRHRSRIGTWCRRYP